jgi:hypothetical protein
MLRCVKIAKGKENATYNGYTKLENRLFLLAKIRKHQLSLVTLISASRRNAPLMEGQGKKRFRRIQNKFTK